MPYVFNPFTSNLDATGTSSSGTVTSVSVVSANGLAGTVANPTTTPAITLSTTVTGLLKGNGTEISAAVGDTDYQLPISLTTTGTSGDATFIGDVLNIPQYSGGGGSPAGVDGDTQFNVSGSFGVYSGSHIDSTLCSSSYGLKNIVTGTTSTASGYYNTASGSSSSAIGFNNASTNPNSTAIGYQNNACGDNAISIGYQNISSGTCSVAVGGETTASAYLTSAFGTGINNSTANSTEIGPDDADKLQISSLGVNFISSGGCGYYLNGIPIGGGFTVLTATGTRDGGNTVFTFSTATQPSFIVSDGAWYPPTDDNGGTIWTWDSGSMEATMVIPPNTFLFGIQ
jgi:hypothetical protein